MAAHGSVQAERRHQDYMCAEVTALVERVRELESEVKRMRAHLAALDFEVTGKSR